MNGSEEANFHAKHTDVTLDLTEVLNKLFDSMGLQPEKYLLHMAAIRLSGHEVEMLRVLSQAYPDLAKQVLAFYQQRVEDHKRASRISRIISFKSSESIELEAAMMALEETRALVSEVSLLKEQCVRRLVENHGEALMKIIDTFVELMRGREAAGGEYYRNVMQRLLREGTGNENV